jgi:hypothetical protein
VKGTRFAPLLTAKKERLQLRLAEGEGVMTRSAHHRLVAPVPDEMSVWHLVVVFLAILLAIAWFACWVLPAF